MTDDVLAYLERVPLSQSLAAHLKCTESLHLRRAWPRAADHLLLELRDESNTLVPAQWRSDSSRLEHAADEISRAMESQDIQSRATILKNGRHSILLQPWGEDRRLTFLAACVQQADTTLLSHRPERRAVVRIGFSDGPTFSKFTSPERTSALIARSAYFAQFQFSHFRSARLLDSDVERGVTAWQNVEGINAFDLDAEALCRSSPSIARALHELHSLAPPIDAPMHLPTDEVKVLRSWTSHVKAFSPQLWLELHAKVEDCCCDLQRLPHLTGLIHRDFFDKQVFVQPDQRVAFIDFDTLARGDFALDIANWIAHVIVRSIQRDWPKETMLRAARSFLSGYASSQAADLPHRINVYLTSALLRLACVYAFRPQSRSTITHASLAEMRAGL